MRTRHLPFLAPVALIFIMACDRSAAPSPSSPTDTAGPESPRRDNHSFANPDEVVVRHLELDWDVRFDRRVLDGTATLHIERVAEGAGRLRLDTRDLFHRCRAV